MTKKNTKAVSRLVRVGRTGPITTPRKTRGIKVRNKAYGDGGNWNDPQLLRDMLDDYLVSDRPMPEQTRRSKSNWLKDPAIAIDLPDKYHTSPIGVRDALQRCCSLLGKKGDYKKFKSTYFQRLEMVKSGLDPDRRPTKRDWFLFKVMARGFNMAENPRRLNDEERALVLGLSVRTIRKMGRQCRDTVDDYGSGGLFSTFGGEEA